MHKCKVPALLQRKDTWWRKSLLDEIFLAFGQYEGDHNVSNLIVAQNYLQALIDKEVEYAKRKT